MNDEDDLARLRRQIRAMAVVNEHLRVQLEALRQATPSQGAAPAADAAPPAGLRSAARRGEIARDWIPALLDDAADRRSADPIVVVRDDRSIYVVEGPTRRRLSVTLMLPALEQLYGERRLLGDDEFHQLAEGPPVEVLEGPTGAPFVIVGGRRLAVRGLGLPHGVDQSVIDALPEGPQLDVSGALVARRAGMAAEWIVPLTDATAADAHLAVAPDGRVVVVEGQVRRSIPAGLLLPALESVLGHRRPIGQDGFDQLDEGPPVELLEGRTGLPFIVVGGRRLPVTGLPLPHPVERSPLDGLPEGASIATAAAVLPRRGNAATAWVASLAGPAPDRAPELVDSAEGAPHVRDGDLYRRVASGMLVAALEPRYGPRRPATDDELAAWTPGPPVEVLEGPKGLPFVVIGSVRIPVHNLPLTHPVRASALDGLPEGPPLDLAEPQRAARAALKAAEAQAAQPPDPRGELKALVEKKGVVRATTHLIRRRPDDR